MEGSNYWWAQGESERVREMDLDRSACVGEPSCRMSHAVCVCTRTPQPKLSALCVRFPFLFLFHMLSPMCRLRCFPNRHGLPEVCITVINNMYGYNAMEVQEAFIKIKEQARAYLALPLDLQAGGKGCCRWLLCGKGGRSASYKGDVCPPPPAEVLVHLWCSGG